MRTEDQIVLRSVKIAPTAGELQELDDLLVGVTDWSYLQRILIERGAAPLFFKKLGALKNSACIPAEVMAGLQQTYYLTLSRGMLMYHVFSDVINAFRERGIQAIALKGIYLAESMYKDIALRQFSDIDLLIQAEDGEKALDILRTMGYTAYDSREREIVVKTKSEAIHYPPMIKEGVSIELHTRLNRKKESYDLPVERLWEHAVRVQINNTAVYTLDRCDTLIHLCVHADKHFREGKIQFTCFNDICNFVDKYLPDWDELIIRSRAYGCESLVFEYIVLVNKYLCAAIPESIQRTYSGLLTEADELRFIRYVGGNFETFSAVPFHLKNIRELNSVFEKLKYLLAVVFPDKNFMLHSYKIRYSEFFWLYYPYRWYTGLRGLIQKKMFK